MKIKFKEEYFGHKKGQEWEFSDNFAKSLIKRGTAEEVKEEEPKTKKVSKPPKNKKVPSPAVSK